jgi:hypothetical protein
MNSRLVLQDANQMIDITLMMEKELQNCYRKNKKQAKKVNLKKERTDAKKF